MKIVIETTCKEKAERVALKLSNFCKDNFRQSTIKIDNEKVHEHDWRSDLEKNEK